MQDAQSGRDWGPVWDQDKDLDKNRSWSPGKGRGLNELKDRSHLAKRTGTEAQRQRGLGSLNLLVCVDNKRL